MEYKLKPLYPFPFGNEMETFSIESKKNKWHGADLCYSHCNLLDILFSLPVSLFKTV